ncbi:tetratricopeptide repeat protein [Singulisphaera sp. PoT]|uniref:tetratricopeptide repeat protein n=1 Tax=Singulisphaera sp. PoT TaxID=3411797 RepID=UPI003BF5A913
MPHCHLGGILGKLGRHEEAASYLRRAIDLDPTQAYAYTLLEHSLAALGKHEEALEVLRKGVRSATNPAPVYVALGRALTNLGRSAEAVEPFRKAVELEPNSPMSHTLLGHALNATGKTDGAIAHYRQAIRLDPNMPEPYNNLAQVLSLQGHGEEAILYLQQAIRLNPSFAVAHSNLCSILHNAGWLREAIAHGRQAVRLNPRLAATHHNLGIALASAGHLDEAIQHLREAVNLQPSSAEAHSSLSLALYESGRWAETRDTAGRGLALLPRSSAYGEGMTRRKAKSENFLRLEGRLPAMLRGEETPKNAAEALDFAHICHATGQYAAAATLYASAFSADPGLLERVAEGQRFRAACSAVLAANDPGEPGKSPTDAERAKLRAQALAWLQVDRNAWRAGLEDRDPSTRAGAVAGLRRWRGNDRLASVRDESALARLPEGERQSWRSFWASVGELSAGDLAAPLDRARAFASRSDWTRAASQYARHFELFPADDGELWFEYAAVQWLSGDAPGYRKACAHMLDRCQKGSPSIRPYHAARACTLAPGLAGEVARANEYASRELLAFASDFWSLTEQGALAQRAGHPSEAIPLLEKSLRANDRPGAAILDWLWLALAHRSRHAEDQARPWITRAEEWLKLQGEAMPANAGDMDLHFHNWLEAQVLSRELAGPSK